MAAELAAKEDKLAHAQRTAEAQVEQLKQLLQQREDAEAVLRGQLKSGVEANDQSDAAGESVPRSGVGVVKDCPLKPTNPSSQPVFHPFSSPLVRQKQCLCLAPPPYFF